MENSVKKTLFASFGFKLFLIVACTIVTSGALTYGFLYSGRRQTGENKIVSTCFDVSFVEGKSIALSNAASMSDASGQSTAPYTFSVTNNCEIETSYTVILSTKIGSINPKFISTSLNGEVANALSDSLENNDYEVDDGYGDSFILETGSIKLNETAKFDLRVWINSKATYDDVKGMTWEGEVKVVSGVKEVEDLKYLSSKLKTIAKKTNPDFSKSSTEDGVYILRDDDGDSYYYRGAHEANHMYFAGMYWRLVRLNGDGSLRIAYDGKAIHQNGDASEDRLAIKNVAPLIEGNDDNLNSKLSDWYQSAIVAREYDKYVANASFCEDAKTNTTTPTFVCNSKIIKKVGLLSLDEVVASGAQVNESTTGTYLYRKAKFWLSTNSNTDSKFVLSEDGNIANDDITTPNDVVPVINISGDYVKMITGSGTIEDPYTL